MKEKTRTAEPQAAPAAKPQVPDGMDEACFNQGWSAGEKQTFGAVALPQTNPFDAASNAGTSWQAGFDAFQASLTPPDPE